MAKAFLYSVITFGFFSLYPVEYEVKLDNEYVVVFRVKIMPKEKIGMHYDEYPQSVYAIKGGILTRLEANGSIAKVEFPTGAVVFRDSETKDKMHETINNTEDFIELIITQLKKNK